MTDPLIGSSRAIFLGVFPVVLATSVPLCSAHVPLTAARELARDCRAPLGDTTGLATRASRHDIPRAEVYSGAFPTPAETPRVGVQQVQHIGGHDPAERD